MDKFTVRSIWEGNLLASTDFYGEDAAIEFAVETFAELEAEDREVTLGITVQAFNESGAVIWEQTIS